MPFAAGKPRLRHWHRNAGLYSDAGTTLATENDQVLEWHDTIAGDIVSQPSINTSCPTLLADGLFFDGDDFLENAASVNLGSGARTVILLVRRDSSIAGKDTIFTINRNEGANSGRGYVVTSEIGLRVSGGNRIFDAVLSDTQFDIIVMTNPANANTNNTSVYVNGVQLNTTSTGSRALNTDGTGGFSFGKANEQGLTGSFFGGFINAGVLIGHEYTQAEAADITIQDLLPTGGTPNDTTPDQFTLIDQNNLARSTPVESNVITVSGINAPTTISVDVGEYRVNAGTYTSTASTVNNGDTVQLRNDTSPDYSTSVDMVCDIGGVTDTWTITAEAAPASDTTPDQFLLTDQVDVALDTPIESNVITITGIDTPTPISVTNAQYRINAGVYTTVSGTVNNNDTVQLLLSSASNNNVTTSAILDVGGVTDTWSVTTEAVLVAEPEGVIFTPDTNLDLAWALNRMPALETQGKITITTSGRKVYRGSSQRVYGQLEVSTFVDRGTAVEFAQQLEDIQDALANVTRVDVGAIAYEVIKVMSILPDTQQEMKQATQVRLIITIEVGDRIAT